MVRDTKLVLVRFIMKNAPYNVGETAGFVEKVAQRFVDRKRAVFYHPEPEVEPKAKTEPPKAKKEAVDKTAPEKVVPEKLNGPFYMVAGEKIRGKKKAQERADELNEAAPVE